MNLPSVPGFCYLKWFREIDFSESQLQFVAYSLGPYPPLNRVVARLFLSVDHVYYYLSGLEYFGNCLSC